MVNVPGLEKLGLCTMGSFQYSSIANVPEYGCWGLVKVRFYNMVHF